jgi:O-antigen/teichoic acid export membrane protein
MSDAVAHGRRQGFLVNTLWTWAAVVTSLVLALIVTPLITRRLGPDAYGLWVLVFAFTEYYTIVDLGVRSAVVKYVAQHATLGETDELHRVLNTAFAYFGLGGIVLLVFTVLIAPVVSGLFDIPPELRATSVHVLMATGASVAFTFAFMWLGASLEAIQRFDLSYRIVIGIHVARVAATVAVLLLGFGLFAIVAIAVAARLVQCLLVYRAFMRQFPGLRWSRRFVSGSTFRKLFAFSVFTLPSTAGSMLLDHGPGVIVGLALPVAYVGYYSLPRRLLQSVLDLVHRMGSVTTARSAELVARNDRAGLVRLAVQSNRYGLVVFMPATIFLWLFGETVFSVWLTPEFAAFSAPLLPVFLLGVVLADASQFNSSSMLYGLARHHGFGFLLLAEALLSSALVYYFARAGSLWNAALAASILMIISRGVLTPYLLCLHLRYSLVRYLADVSIRPLAAGVIAAGVMWGVKTAGLPMTSLLDLGLAGVLTTAVYALIAGRLCVLPEDRDWIMTLVASRAPRLVPATRVWLGR